MKFLLCLQPGFSPVIPLLPVQNLHKITATSFFPGGLTCQLLVASCETTSFIQWTAHKPSKGTKTIEKFRLSLNSQSYYHQLPIYIGMGERREDLVKEINYI